MPHQRSRARDELLAWARARDFREWAIEYLNRAAHLSSDGDVALHRYSAALSLNLESGIALGAMIYFSLERRTRTQHFASDPVVKIAEVHPNVGFLQDILTQRFGV